MIVPKYKAFQCLSLVLWLAGASGLASCAKDAVDSVRETETNELQACPEGMRMPLADVWPAQALFTVAYKGETLKGDGWVGYRGWGLQAPSKTKADTLCLRNGSAMEWPKPISADSIAPLDLSSPWTGDRLVAAGLYRVAQNAQVPAGAKLILSAGVALFFAPAADLVVEGELVAQGSPDNPVVLTATDSSGPWGGLVIHGSADLRETMISAGGANPTRNYGHSNSHPVLDAMGGSVVARHVWIMQNAGKGIGGYACQFRMDSSLVAWSDMGGEFNDCELHVDASAFLFFPDSGSNDADDDNDAIYVRMSDPPGSDTVWSTIARTVFHHGKDDAIDHNGSMLKISDVYIYGFRHEGLASSQMGVAWITNSVVDSCEQGIEAGYGAPLLKASRLLLRNNTVGVRYGDSYPEQTHTGWAEVDSTAFAHNGVDVLNEPGTAETIAVERVNITYSELRTGTDFIGSGNVSPDTGAYGQASHVWPQPGYTKGPEGWPWQD